jgi:hypothetical protein
MPYCLACGKLRKTTNGLCNQCIEDDYLARNNRPLHKCESVYPSK